MRFLSTILSIVIISAPLFLTTGCAAFRMSVADRDPAEASRLSAKYDHEDLLTLSTEMVEAVLSTPNFPGPKDKNPILADMGIQNRTKSHLDMKAMADTITTKLMDTGKIRLTNTNRRDALLREQGFQLTNCTPETRSKIGKQLGAKYMMTGSLAEIEKTSGRQVRVSEKQDVYYQLTVEITDLESGLVVVKKQKDRLRRASKPLIGW